MDVVYDEEEASVAQDRDACNNNNVSLYATSVWYVTNITYTNFVWPT